ncbi:hypothetical protein D3C78_376400 [compost metagenome]
MQLQQYRHQRLGALAGQAALVAEEEVLHQLLGQGTAALHQRTGGGVDPHGAGDRLGRHPEMVVELAILDRDQGFQQVRRHLVQLDQDAVLVVRRIQAADQQRLQPRHRQRAAVGQREPGHLIAGKAHAQLLRRLGAFVELETAGMQFDLIAVHRQLARPLDLLGAPVAKGLQFGDEVLARQLEAGEQLQRPGIDLGRHGPALAGELLLDHGVEVDRQPGQQHQADHTEFEQPAQPRSGRARRRLARTRGTRRGGTRSCHGGHYTWLDPGG